MNWHGKDDGILNLIETMTLQDSRELLRMMTASYAVRALKYGKCQRINSKIPLLRRKRAFLGVQYGYIDLPNFSPPSSTKAIVRMWQLGLAD